MNELIIDVLIAVAGFAGLFVLCYFFPIVTPNSPDGIKNRIERLEETETTKVAMSGVK